MKEQPTQQRIDRLPKWARDHIKNVARQRDAAVRKLNEFEDTQTPGPFSYDDFVCDGAGKDGSPGMRKRYVSGAHRMNINHAGVELEVCLRDDLIDLRWDSEDARLRYNVVMQPRSSNNVHLYIVGA